MRAFFIFILLCFIAQSAKGQEIVDKFDILAWDQVEAFGMNKNKAEFTSYFINTHTGDRAVIVRKQFIDGPMLLLGVFIRRTDGNCFIGRPKIEGKYRIMYFRPYDCKPFDYYDWPVIDKTVPLEKMRKS